MEREPFHHDEYREGTGREASSVTLRQQINGSSQRSMILRRKLRKNMDKYELGIAPPEGLRFRLGGVLDWYIEMVKPRLWNDRGPDEGGGDLDPLKTVLINSLKLLRSVHAAHHGRDLLQSYSDDEPSIMISLPGRGIRAQEWNFAEGMSTQSRSSRRLSARIRNVRTSKNRSAEQERRRCTL